MNKFIITEEPNREELMNELLETFGDLSIELINEIIPYIVKTSIKPKKIWKIQ